MNVSNTTPRTPADTTRNVVAIASKSRRSYGARSFGVGYGSSSG